MPWGRPGTEIPGYRGYIPGKSARNIFGVSYRSANKLASEDEYPEPNKSSGNDDYPWMPAAGFPSRPRSKGPLLPPLPLSEMRRQKSARGKVSPSPVPGETDVTKNDADDRSTFGSNDSLLIQESLPRCRPGTEIPGYTGYVPKKNIDNVFGATFKEVNQRAITGTDPNPEETTEKVLFWRSQAIQDSQSLSPMVMPGYAGYLPGTRPSNVFGLTWCRANALGAPSEGPHPINSRSGYNLNLWRNPARNLIGMSTHSAGIRTAGCGDEELQTLTESATIGKHCPEPVSSSCRPTELPVGYGGHVPHTGPANLFGATWKVINDLSAAKAEISEAQRIPTWGNAENIQANQTSSRSRSLSVGEPPGYTGFVTRKHAGVGFHPSNKHAALEMEAWPPFKTSKRSRSLSPSSLYRDIPAGYTGHVPGRFARNIFGLGWHAGNACAASARESVSLPPAGRSRTLDTCRSDGPAPTSRSLSPEPHSSSKQESGGTSPDRRTRSPSLGRAAPDVPPGYTGHVPRKSSRNVYGVGWNATVALCASGIDAARTPLYEPVEHTSLFP